MRSRGEGAPAHRNEVRMSGRSPRETPSPGPRRPGARSNSARQAPVNATATLAGLAAAAGNIHPGSIRFVSWVAGYNIHTLSAHSRSGGRAQPKFCNSPAAAGQKPK